MIATITALALAVAPPDAEAMASAPSVAAARAWVAAMTRSRTGRQVARWEGPVCPEVMNLKDPATVALVQERLAALAGSVGVRVERRCRSNVVIMFTNFPDRAAAELARGSPGLFRDDFDGMPSAAERDAFLHAPAPVRWVGESRVAYNGNIHPSRIVQHSRQDATRTFVIVDALRIDRVTWGQLADYVALVALVQPQLGAGYPAESILSLFDDAAAPHPAGATRADRAYLQALYAIDTARAPASERAAIADEFLARMRAPAGSAAAVQPSRPVRP